MSTRRDFLRTAAGAGVGAALGGALLPGAVLKGAPFIHPGRQAPLVVMIGGGTTAAEVALGALDEEAEGVEAAVAGVSAVERGAGARAAGSGGHSGGVVRLDARVADGRTGRSGRVSALEGIRSPSRVALDVLRHGGAPHLEGDEAQAFAVALGHPLDLDGSRCGLGAGAAVLCTVLDARGHLAAAAVRRPFARGAGSRGAAAATLHVDDAVGACGATGDGEATGRGARAVVALMGRGLSATDACLEVVRRLVREEESRLPASRGRPGFDVGFHAVSRLGAYGGAAVWSGRRFAVGVDGHIRYEESAHLFERAV